MIDEFIQEYRTQDRILNLFGVKADSNSPYILFDVYEQIGDHQKKIGEIEKIEEIFKFFK